MIKATDLTPYQTTVFIELAKSVSDEAALDLIEKNGLRVVELERRKYLPAATAQALLGVEIVEGAPLCPVHKKLEDAGQLEAEYGNDCVACSLHERTELLEVLATAVPEGEKSPGSVDFLKALLREREWQTIESAPKDGRTLLLGYENLGGKWRTVRGQWFSEQMIMDEWEDPDDGQEGWYETSEAADDPPNCWPVTPSHWMVLPKKPKEIQ